MHKTTVINFFRYSRPLVQPYIIAIVYFMLIKYYQMIKFTSDYINYSVNIIVYSAIPLLMIRFLIRRALWFKHLLLISLIPVEIFILTAFIVNGFCLFFGERSHPSQNIKLVEMPDYRLVAYLGGFGVLSDPSITVEQERDVLPFVKLRKTVFFQKLANDVDIRQIGPDRFAFFAPDPSGREERQPEIVEMTPWF